MIVTRIKPLPAQRSNPKATLCECKVLKELDNYGVLYLSNENLYGYFPDILLARYSVIIEVDGGYHFKKKQRKKDKQRENHLKEKGFVVYRINNTDTLNPLKIRVFLLKIFKKHSIPVSTGNKQPKILKVVSKI
jgi:very-short-patch-repair endonuclease